MNEQVILRASSANWTYAHFLAGWCAVKRWEEPRRLKPHLAEGAAVERANDMLSGYAGAFLGEKSGSADGPKASPDCVWAVPGHHDGAVLAASITDLFGTV